MFFDKAVESCMGTVHGFGYFEIIRSKKGYLKKEKGNNEIVMFYLLIFHEIK